jgi:hypothetical protein
MQETSLIWAGPISLTSRALARKCLRSPMSTSLPIRFHFKEISASLFKSEQLLSNSSFCIKIKHRLNSSESTVLSMMTISIGLRCTLSLNKEISLEASLVLVNVPASTFSLRTVCTACGQRIFLPQLIKGNSLHQICMVFIHILCTNIRLGRGLVSYTTWLQHKIGGLRMIKLMASLTYKLWLLVEELTSI